MEVFDSFEVPAHKGNNCGTCQPALVESLANLEGIKESEITHILDYLHSLFGNPTDQNHPARLLNLSFRDFLLKGR